MHAHGVYSARKRRGLPRTRLARPRRRPGRLCRRRCMHQVWLSPPGRDLGRQGRRRLPRQRGGRPLELAGCRALLLSPHRATRGRPRGRRTPDGCPHRRRRSALRPLVLAAAVGRGHLRHWGRGQAGRRVRPASPRRRRRIEARRRLADPGLGRRLCGVGGGVGRRCRWDDARGAGRRPRRCWLRGRRRRTSRARRGRRHYLHALDGGHRP
mmetsp:Transcript_20285/g.68750  ORF Transcript_20285/g.68750 Transcript_20285/m.68750 type:complete len:211 (+) Transcript_20285:97-729(+)